jgi:DNA-binding NtrC family response regulator
VLSKGGVILREQLFLPLPPAPASVSSALERASFLRALARRVLSDAPGLAHQRFIEEAEAQLILESLDKTRGNSTQAARLLGISRPTLREKIARYRIDCTIIPEQKGEQAQEDSRCNRGLSS